MHVAPDPAHFARAVTELGERRPVVVSAAIYNTQGIKVIDKGVSVDASLYERLTQHRLQQPLEQNLSLVPSITGSSLSDLARRLIEQEPFLSTLLSDLRVREQLLEEIKHVPLPHPVAVQLTVLNETRPQAWMHALRSMLVAGWLAGVQEGGTRHDMRMLAVGGLLYDIGMLHVDPVLQRPQVELTDFQRRHLYTHPLVSVMVLERHQAFPADLLRAVLEHHECLDGSGYPRGIGGEAISPWGRILGLTKVVAALADAGAPRLSVVLRMNWHRYDKALAVLVERAIAAFRATPAKSDVDALACLGEVEALLRAWPAEPPADMKRERREACDVLYGQCAQALRVLAETGVAGGQQPTLDAAPLDAAAQGELALIAHEAAWQLRVVTRQARRRIRDSEGALPAWLQSWLASADQLCARMLSDVAGRTVGVPAA